MKPEVIIIGAGAAGLAAAKVLSEHGRRVLIVEARDRIGGRILTHFEPSSPIPLELGPEFVHGRPRVTLELGREAGLTAIELPDRHFQKERGRWIEMPDMEEQLDSVMGGLGKLNRDISFAQYMKRHAGGSPRARRFALNFVEGFDAADPSRVSSLSLAEEQDEISGDDGQSQYRLLQGYHGLVEYLWRYSAKHGVKTRLRYPVFEIHWSKSKVMLNRSSAVQAPRAIVTLPLGVLQIPWDVPGAVRFTPAISANLRAAMQLASGPIVKAILRFERPFWEDTRRLRDSAFWHMQEAPFPTWWTQQPLHLPILTAWAGGPKATALLGLPRREMLAAATQSLMSLLDVTKKRVDSMLKGFYVYDWASDPFARGAYSYVTVGGMGARRRLAQPLENTLYFAGEATDTSGQASTVAGALNSGQRAAHQVLAGL